MEIIVKWSLEDVCNEQWILEKSASCSQFKVTKIPSKFAQPTEYFPLFWPLVIEELRCCLDTAFQRIHERPGESNLPVEEFSWSKKYGDSLTIGVKRRSLSGSGGLKKGLKVRINDVLLLTSTKDASSAPLHPHFLGVIVDIDDAIGRNPKVPTSPDDIIDVSFTVSKSIVSTVLGELDLVSAGKWRFSILGSIVTGMRILSALGKKEEPPFFKHILDPTGVVHLPVVQPTYCNLNLEGLNESQKNAILEATYGESPVTLIQGPPGTGKTKTLSSFLLNRIMGRCDEAVTVVVAATNAAISELAERLLNLIPFHQGEDIKISDMVLIGNEEKLKSQLLTKVYLPHRIDRIKLALKKLPLLVMDVQKIFETTINDDEFAKAKIIVPETYCSDMSTVMEDLALHCGVLADELPTGIVKGASDNSFKKLHEVSTNVIKMIPSLKKCMQSVSAQLLSSTWQAYLKDAKICPSYLRKDIYEPINVLRTIILRAFVSVNKIISVVGSKPRDQDGRLVVLIMKSTKMTFSTISCAGRQCMKEVFKRKTIVVVDESSQAVEAETVIVLRSKVQKLILAGDPKQLPATVFSPICVNKKYERSLFDRFQSHGWHTCLLNTQYRMHPIISRWPSETFYEGRLKNGKNVRAHDYVLEWHGGSSPYGEIRFIDVLGGREETKLKTFSKFNTSEANYIVEIIRRLGGNFEKLAFETTIGVITPYAAQTDLLSKKLAAFSNSNDNPFKYKNCIIDINSVDGFQGQERDIIIFSCVRTTRNIGFLSDPRRLNVAVTRAKKLLLVIGHKRVLSNADRTWRQLINYCDKQQMIFSNRKNADSIEKLVEETENLKLNANVMHGTNKRMHK